MVKTSFEIAQKLKLQSATFDFVKKNDKYYLLEMSYDFNPSGGTNDSKWYGYWDKKLIWHNKKVDPVVLMIENLIKEITL